MSQKNKGKPKEDGKKKPKRPNGKKSPSPTDKYYDWCSDHSIGTY